mmetsp:Transcript_28019/g.46365  ORF Transcript_28019/g.46365 Transcript_28019/m.46365 type:complete len:438 (-) Transcript_28019:122-1435(-)
MTIPMSFMEQQHQMQHQQHQPHQQQQRQQFALLDPNEETVVSLQQPSNKLLSETTSTGIPAFPWKLHDVLEDAEKKGFTHIVSWTMNGRAFKVHDQKTFETDIMTKYFNQTQYKSFQRQLNIYNFIRITSGDAKGSYTHDLLVRGKPDICRFMVRTKIKRKGSKSNMAISTSSERLNQLASGGPNTLMMQATQGRMNHSADALLMMRNNIDNNNSNMPMNGAHNQVFSNTTTPMSASSASFLFKGLVGGPIGGPAGNTNLLGQLQSQTQPQPPPLDANNNSFMMGGSPYSPVAAALRGKGSNGTNTFLNNQLQPNQVTSNSRRLSVNLFQQVSDELLMGRRPAPTNSDSTTTMDDMACSNRSYSSSEPNFTNANNTNPMMIDQDMLMGQVEDMDHIFDDDIESIGEPVSLEHASPYVKSESIPPDIADEMLRCMFRE